MKLMRCFNLIIIKITSLFSYLAEFDSLSGVEREVMPGTPTLPQREAGEANLPKMPSHPLQTEQAHLPRSQIIPQGLSLRLDNEGRETAR